MSTTQQYSPRVPRMSRDQYLERIWGPVAKPRPTRPGHYSTAHAAPNR